MDESIDVLIALPLPEHLVAKLQELSPRLSVHVQKASRVEDISPEQWATVDVLYTGRVLPMPDQAPNLKWIQFHYAGIDHVRDAPILRKEGVKATTMSGASASQVAEYAVMMMLALGHRLPDLLDHQRRSLWPKDRWERFSPVELRNHTVGIVGYGSIGRQIARLLIDFGAKILATKRDAMHPDDKGYIVEGQGDEKGDFVHRLYPAEAIRSMVKECDFVVVCIPLTPQTRGLMNAEVFEAMKPTAYLVDASRGGVVDHTALISALREHKIAGAALDVFPEEPLPENNPLWKMPNVIITPHISGNTPFYDERAMDLFIENMKRYLTGQPLFNLVDVDQGY
ncbi:MAG: D-2-hydroxyacid dehydrogenase [Anaerolineales bacterium]|nr:D-2-hydroxyacid dehydrogenase [Anaerolineales bacterium]